MIIDDRTVEDIPSTTIADDGIKPPPSESSIPPVEQRPLGYILDEEDEEKVAKHVTQHRKDQAPAMSRRRAVWKRNRWWREGRRWVRLEKLQDQSKWVAKLPFGMGSMPPLPNKTDRLCRRLGNTLLVDKPFPECEPGDDSNEARDAAEFATRFLTVKGSQAELNFASLCRHAFDKACTYASSFAWVTMDPGGAGHRPRTMLAHPNATTKENALEDPKAGEALGIPGLSLKADEDELQDRYVRADGYLTDDPSEADLQWLPAVKVRLLTGLQLTFLPEMARGIDDCIGVVITDVTTLGELKTLFPTRFERMSEEELEKLCVWRPDHVEDLLPPYTKMPEHQKYDSGDKDGQYKDSQVVVTSTIYYRRCAEYPLGAYAVIGGETMVLHRQQWTAKMPQPASDDNQPRPAADEVLRIPVSQDRCLDDDTTDDPFGVGIAEHLGAADEIAASALGFEIEHMFNSANPHIFVPIGSAVQPNQVLERDRKPKMVNPQGKPEWEIVPPLSATVPQLREEMQQDQNDALGLQQAAQGVEDPSVTSGIHARVIVQESLKAVSNMKDNLGDFYVRLCEIVLEQTRAFSTVPQLLSYTGEDGAYKQREWSRTDFGTTKRVSIAKGSFTLHTVDGKQQMAAEMLQAQVIDQDEYADLVSGGVSPIVGKQDNPHLMRVRRQIEAYLEGPPEGWVQAYQQYQQQMALAQQQAQLAAQSAPPPMPGQPPAPAAPAAPPPVPPPTPFTDRLPPDLEPMPAKIRHRQLSRMLASTRFERFKESAPEWQQPALAEYLDMKNAAGIMTVPEVQAAQAAEKQAEAQQYAQAEQIKVQQAQTDANLKEKELALKYAPKPDAPPAQPPVINVHLPPEGPKTVTHVRDDTGRIVGSHVVPQAE